MSSGSNTLEHRGGGTQQEWACGMQDASVGQGINVKQSHTEGFSGRGVMKENVSFQFIHHSFN